MKKALFAFLLAATSVSAVQAAAPSILSFKDVRPGMKGTGRTVFRGSEVETFQVEILGTLPNIGPDQNLILGRCTGGPLADTGVLAGMSGSPVFMEDKLIGAIAYSWGFSKEAIAGITPIEEMLAVAAIDEKAASPRPSRSAGPSDFARLRSPATVDSFFSHELTSLIPRPAAAAPISLPLAVSGFGPDGLARIAPDLIRVGFLPVQSAAAGSGRSESLPLEPGSPVGVKLVRGDVDLTATGTVTWVDGHRLLAFGHALYGLGTVDLPLTGARVEALLPSLQQSMRLATPLAEVGAFEQDRSSALLGYLGAIPRMIPVRVHYTDRGGGRRSYAFDIADDPLLAPLLLYTSLNGILESRERMFGNITLRLGEGSVIKMEGQEDIELDNLFSGASATNFATGLSAYILHLLMNNEWLPPKVSGVNLILEYEAEPRTGAIQRVTLDRFRVKAGDSVMATVVVRPFRGPELVLTREIDIPPETPPGRLVLHVGDAMAVNREDADDGRIQPRTLAQLIRLINQLRRNDRVYIVASRDDSGVFLGGARLPNLPPSVTSVLARPRSLGNYSVVPQRGILEEEIRTGYAVEGLARIQLEVQAP